MLGAAIVPLVTLTVMAFLGGGGRTDATSYDPAELAEFEAVEAATGARIAKLPEVEAASAEDPAGFSSEGQPADSLALPYEVAQLLGEADRGIQSTDIGTVQRIRKSIQRLFDDRLTAVEKLRPHGDRLAKAITRRGEILDRHEVWLVNRDRVRESLGSAASAMNDGLEIEGEKKCLELLRKLQKELPEVADASRGQAEPSDALTAEEAEAVAKLRSRAVFREQFFTARRATASKNEKANQLRSQLDAWDAFLKAYDKLGVPDARDAAFLDEARKLRHEAELSWRWGLALSQPSVGGLVAKASDWLRVAKSGGDEDADFRQSAAELVRSWLAKNVPPVPSKPKGLEGLQEAVTDPANKRKFGYFQKVPITDKQYYYWINKANMKVKFKGDSQFNLKALPATPSYLIMLADYERCRAAFLSKGHSTAQGAAEFRDECARLGEKYRQYRTDYADPDDPIDDAAKGWQEVFEKAEKIAAELVAEGDKSAAWELLAPAAN